jgi:hypothetical protein
MDSRTLGLIIVGVGAAVVVVGLIAAAGGFDWLGRLPGDIRLGGERSRVVIPVTSMIVISVVLTILANLFLRR